MSSQRKRVKAEPQVVAVRLWHIVSPQAKSVLGKLFNAKPEAKYSATSFKVSRAYKAWREIQHDYDEQRVILLDEYAFQKDDSKDLYHFWKQEPDLEKGIDGVKDHVALNAFNAAHRELVREMVTFDCFISVDDIANLGVALMPVEMELIYWLIEEGLDDYDPSDGFEDEDEEPK